MSLRASSSSAVGPRVTALVGSRGGSRGGQHLDLTVVNLSPSELTVDPVIGVEGESSCESLDLDVAGSAVQGRGELVGVKAEREIAIAAWAAAVRISGLQGVADCVSQITAQHPRHVREHQAFQVLVVMRVRLERLGGCVCGYAACE